MHHLDKLYLSKFSANTDYDPFFEEDSFRDLELDRELNQFLDITDLDETDHFFWDENQLKDDSNSEQRQLITKFPVYPGSGITIKFKER